MVEGSILLVNHDPSQLRAWKTRLTDCGVPCLHTRDPFAALQLMHLNRVSGIICRFDLPILAGEELSRRVARANPEIVVRVLPPPAGDEAGGAGWKHGELTFREAPFIQAAGVILLGSGMLLSREDGFRRFLSASERYAEIVGQSGPLREVLALMDKVKDQEVTVLIRGESGTGKELVARALHRRGSRAQKPFVSVNSAALSETLLESELFGHEKGAYTGADSRVVGRFEQAAGGCLFLDEIGDMSLKTQSKILRLLEGQEFERLGGREKIRVDVRVLAATNRDLEEGVRSNAFREDLYYRIGAFPIFLPPLRDRIEDIPLLAGAILSDYNRASSAPITGMTVRAVERLLRHDWPGNVRELENTMRRAAIMAGGGMITEREISLISQEAASAPPAVPPPAPESASAESAGIVPLKQVEAEAIRRALSATGMNISSAARGLGISRATLYNKIREYGLKAEDPDVHM